MSTSCKDGGLTPFSRGLPSSQWSSRRKFCETSLAETFHGLCVSFLSELQTFVELYLTKKPFPLPGIEPTLALWKLSLKQRLKLIGYRWEMAALHKKYIRQRGSEKDDPNDEFYVKNCFVCGEVAKPEQVRTTFLSQPAVWEMTLPRIEKYDAQKSKQTIIKCELLKYKILVGNFKPLLLFQKQHNWNLSAKCLRIGTRWNHNFSVARCRNKHVAQFYQKLPNKYPQLFLLKKCNGWKSPESHKIFR